MPVFGSRRLHWSHWVSYLDRLMTVRADIQVETRRQFLLASLGALSIACGAGGAPTASSAKEPGSSGTAERFAELERRTGGRLGIFAIDTGNGRELAYRSEERFGLCSTFKWALAAAVLERVDRGTLSLAEAVPFGPADLLEHAPVTREHLGSGALSIEQLAEASVTFSDNTAANLLLAKIEGPAGLTRFMRSVGDQVTRLDRNEPELNENQPGDPRDTTTPLAMAGLMRRILCEDVLTKESQNRLRGWLRACQTGKNRLRAGLPADWSVGDKTGSGMQNTVSDVAIAVPPGRAPILIAVYTTGGSQELPLREAVHADAARLIAREFAQG